MGVQLNGLCLHAILDCGYIVPVIIAVSIMFMLANKEIIGVMKIKARMAYVLSVIAAALRQKELKGARI